MRDGGDASAMAVALPKFMAADEETGAAEGLLMGCSVLGAMLGVEEGVAKEESTTESTVSDCGIEG